MPETAAHDPTAPDPTAPEQPAARRGAVPLPGAPR
jgi:hypothetical protein